MALLTMKKWMVSYPRHYLLNLALTQRIQAYEFVNPGDQLSGRLLYLYQRVKLIAGGVVRLPAVVLVIISTRVVAL